MGNVRSRSSVKMRVESTPGKRTDEDAIKASFDPSGYILSKPVEDMHDNYKKLKKLGDGAYGEVIAVQHRNTKEVRAMKAVRKAIGEERDMEVRNEVDILRGLGHPNIMRMYEVFEDSSHLYIVMECYEGGELFDEIITRSKFSEADAAVVVEQSLSAMAYLHSHRVVHRDIKPENILLSKKGDLNIKIVDFGLSARIKEGRFLKERHGTSYYIAPEVIHRRYNEKCDVWSLGVILFILLCGYPPFNGADDDVILKLVEAGRYTFQKRDWEPVTKEGRDIVRKMLTYRYENRPSAAEALQHQWIRDKSIRGKMDVSAGERTLTNMKRFTAGCTLSNAALLFIASQCTTQTELAAISEIFKRLDCDGNGMLDRAELIAGYSQLRQSDPSMGPKQIEAEVDSILEADFDNNGFIDWPEFIAISMDRNSLVTRDKIRSAFEAFDTDGSGSISLKELRTLVGNVSDEQWVDICKEVDTNGDGEVDYAEFEAMLKKMAVPEDGCA